MSKYPVPLAWQYRLDFWNHNIFAEFMYAVTFIRETMVICERAMSWMKSSEGGYIETQGSKSGLKHFTREKKKKLEEDRVIYY